MDTQVAQGNAKREMTALTLDENRIILIRGNIPVWFK